MNTANMLLGIGSYSAEQLYTTASETCVSSGWAYGEEQLSFKDNSFLTFNEDHTHVGGGQFTKPNIDFSVLDCY
jgi:hypothetical protein